MASINYISDSIYSPFTLDDYMKPLEAYGRAYDRAEDTLVKVADKTNPFEYLRNLEDGSQAKEIYTKYADALDKANTNFLRNGFNASTLGEVEDLRLRFGKEIGMLAKADERLSQAQAVQDNLRAKDPTRMFSNYNLHIDQFLNGNTPNLYSISGDDIYKRGMQLGQSASARNYKSGEAGSALDNYYKIWKESQGVHPSDIDSFIGSAEIQSYIDQNLESMGVGQLSEEDQMRARQEFTSGLYNGIVYKEATDLKRNEDKPSYSERLREGREEAIMRRQGFVRNADDSWSYSFKNDPDNAKEIWKWDFDEETGLPTGPSEEYKKWLEWENELKHKYDKEGKSGKITPDSPNKDIWQFNSDGTRKLLNKNNIPSSLTEISYNEAVEINGDISSFHPGYYSGYKYFLTPEGNVVEFPNPNAEIWKRGPQQSPMRATVSNSKYLPFGAPQEDSTNSGIDTNGL